MEPQRPRSPVVGSSFSMDTETSVASITPRKGPFQSHGLENVNLMSRILAELEEPTSPQPSVLCGRDDIDNAFQVNGSENFSSFHRTDTSSSSRSTTESTLQSSFSDLPVNCLVDSDNNQEVEDVDNRQSIAAILSRSMSEQMAAAAEFARERSAVMPTLPAGALPLLWTFVFFVGVSLTAYMSLCNGPGGECMDPGAMLTSLRQLDGESANEFFERAKACVAPTADYVVEHLKQMWGRICDGEVSELSQLLTDKNIRVAVLMYLGAVITLCGGYFTITTMDCGNTLSSSYAQLVSSLNTKERLASVTKRFEANSTAFAQWRDAATASMFREEEDKCAAPTPLISISSFFIFIARVVQWVTSFAAGKKTTVELDTEQARREEEQLRIRKRALWLTPEVNAASELDTPASPESSSAHLGNQFSIFLRAREPQILSFLQRLDVTAAILGILFILLVLFLYHKAIKQFLSYCVVPTVCLVSGCGVGRIGYLLYQWMSRTRELRSKQVSILSASARSHLSGRHKGGPYPVDFIFEELKDLLFSSAVDNALRSAHGTPSKIKNDIEIVALNQDIDVKTFRRLWHLVVIDVLQDKRILSIVMIYEGARRTCWKSLGAKEEILRPVLSPPPDSTKVLVPTTDTEPKVNPIVQRNGIIGLIVFIVRVLFMLFSGVFNGFGFVLKQVWKWMR